MGNHMGRAGCIRLKDEDADAGKAIMHRLTLNRMAPVQWFADIDDYFEELHISSDAAKCELDWETIQLRSTL
ncbi:hypothetical protein ACLKA6_007265 [Drosophila palustris]